MKKRNPAIDIIGYKITKEFTLPPLPDFSKFCPEPSDFSKKKVNSRGFNVCCFDCQTFDEGRPYSNIFPDQFTVKAYPALFLYFGECVGRGKG